jgi:hypothetical protein
LIVVIEQRLLLGIALQLQLPVPFFYLLLYFLVSSITHNAQKVICTSHSPLAMIETMTWRYWLTAALFATVHQLEIAWPHKLAHLLGLRVEIVSLLTKKIRTQYLL